VHAGEIWLDNRMTAEVMKGVSEASESGPRREKPGCSATARKKSCNLVAQGFRNKEIGEKLFIFRANVQKPFAHNIFDKLGVSDRLELALYAPFFSTNRLIEPDVAYLFVEAQ